VINMTERTPEQARTNYQELMGDELGVVYHELWQEMARIYTKWEEYVGLFGTDESRVKLMNEAAPRFFYTVQTTLWESTILHIARLTDPAETNTPDGPRQNLTLRRLPSLIDDRSTRASVNRAINEAGQACAFARELRNRWIAHTDLAVALNDERAVPLPAASRLMVKEALASLSGVMNAVSTHYVDSTNLFGGWPVQFGAESLLYTLELGMKDIRERR
jgi:hypothetical protein